MGVATAMVRTVAVVLTFIIGVLIVTKFMVSIYGHGGDNDIPGRIIGYYNSAALTQYILKRLQPIDFKLYGHIPCLLGMDIVEHGHGWITNVAN